MKLMARKGQESQPARPEVVIVPDDGQERGVVDYEPDIVMAHEAPQEQQTALIVVPPSKSVVAMPKDPALVQIESILSDRLGDVFVALPDELKPKFKAKGEETAAKIQKLVQSSKDVAGKILRLIRKWLAMVPGVSKYFLEQESKIKTDHILAIRNK